MTAMLPILLIMCVQNTHASLDSNETVVLQNRYRSSDHHYMDRSGYWRSCSKHCKCDWPASDGTVLYQSGCQQQCCAPADRLKLKELERNSTSWQDQSIHLEDQLKETLNETVKCRKRHLAIQLQLEAREKALKAKEKEMVDLNVENNALEKAGQGWMVAFFVSMTVTTILFIYTVAGKHCPIPCVSPAINSRPFCTRLLMGKKKGVAGSQCPTDEDIEMEEEGSFEPDTNGGDDVPVLICAKEKQSNKVEIAGEKGG